MALADDSFSPLPLANEGGNEGIADRMKNMFECLVEEIHRSLDFALYQIGVRQMLARISCAQTGRCILRN